MTHSIGCYNTYGRVSDVFSIQTVPKPTEIKDDEILLKVKAVSLNQADAHIMHGVAKMFFKPAFPAIPGMDFSGVVVEVGKEAAAKFKVDDEVFGSISDTRIGNGACAEYVTLSTKLDLLELKPAHISHEQAASVGIAAMSAATVYLSQLPISPDDPDNKNKKILVIGASGGVGSWAVLIGKYYGFNVTGICSGKNKSFVLDVLKADKVIDYTIAPLQEQMTVAEEYDIMIDCVGGDNYWVLAQTVLSKTGSFATVVGQFKDMESFSFYLILKTMALSIWRPLTNTRKFSQLFGGIRNSFPTILKWLSEDNAVSGSGKIKPPANSVYAFKDSKSAMELLESRRAVGKIVIVLP
ncbi:hypothetical protein HK098_004408 [Nowakowskiella sp. JEL0407]|nr:hypothetical protein HK098_004408 [Nowakowskiella sp. JEL0407]